MGYYVNQDSKGNVLPAQGKFQALIADGGQEVSGTEFRENLICVVRNGPFDAAGYAYDEREWEVFRNPNGRPTRWLVHPDAKKLSGFDQ